MSQHEQQLTGKLMKASRMLLTVKALNAGASALSGIFVNVYLFKVSESLLQVLSFHLASFSAWVHAFVGAAWLGKKAGRTIGLLLGNGGFLCFYLCILVLGQGSAAYSIPLPHPIGRAAYRGLANRRAAVRTWLRHYFHLIRCPVRLLYTVRAEAPYKERFVSLFLARPALHS